jgi:hypothetical protein
MLLKELSRAWPPEPLDDREHVTADPQDVVVSAKNEGKNKLSVRLRKPGKYGVEYNVMLRLPENVFQKTLFSIMRERGITLAEVGEITIQ